MLITCFGEFYYDIEEQEYIGYFGLPPSDAKRWHSIMYRDVLLKIIL